MGECRGATSPVALDAVAESDQRNCDFSRASGGRPEATGVGAGEIMASAPIMLLPIEVLLPPSVVTLKFEAGLKAFRANDEETACALTLIESEPRRGCC